MGTSIRIEVLIQPKIIPIYNFASTLFHTVLLNWDYTRFDIAAVQGFFPPLLHHTNACLSSTFLVSFLHCLYFCHHCDLSQKTKSKSPATTFS